MNVISCDRVLMPAELCKYMLEWPNDFELVEIEKARAAERSFFQGVTVRPVSNRSPESDWAIQCLLNRRFHGQHCLFDALAY